MTVMSGMAVVVGGAIVLMQLMLGMSGEVRQRTYYRHARPPGRAVPPRRA